MNRTETRETPAAARPQVAVAAARRPGQRPDFVETSACAEIGAYAFQAK